ncbi:MAG: hypothetical protein OEU26_12205 [Candidatus Tectomicrobia bacterium]|nr:hypothetical protein [Candidatus Tectomicrobia bacterium]
MKPLFDLNLELDEGGLDQRGVSELHLDENIQLWARENRITLLMEEQERHFLPDISRFTKPLDLRCVVHPHPECRFIFVRLTIAFNPASGAIVQDLVPKRVDSGQPLKITTTYRGGLSFEYNEVKLSDMAGVEHSKEYQHYFPEIVGSGVNTNRVIWDFKTPMNDVELYVDRDLFLLIAYPEDRSTVTAEITLRARVIRKGLIGYIPLIGKKTQEFRLDQDLTGQV